jgi:hypothetical protein
MLNYNVEKLDDRLIEEMSLMTDLYWNDVAAPFHGFPADPDWVLYKGLEGADRLRVIVGRNDRRQVKAFSVVVLGPHTHYACIQGTVPLLFLHPDYRKGSEGIRLVRLLEKAAEGAGAQIVITHGGMHNGVYRLFEGMHYQDFGRYYVKVKGEGPNGLTAIFKNSGGTPHQDWRGDTPPKNKRREECPLNRYRGERSVPSTSTKEK